MGLLMKKWDIMGHISKKWNLWDEYEGYFSLRPLPGGLKRIEMTTDEHVKIHTHTTLFSGSAMTLASSMAST
jgi:hypothetical protein